MPMPNFPHIPPFRPFIPPMSLPAVYGDELSYMELLTKVEKWLSDLVDSNNLQNAAIVALYAAWEDFKNGGYTDSFEEFLDQWFADNQEHIDELLTGQFADELAAIQETADGAVQTATEAEQAVAGKVNMPTGGTNGQVLSKAATATGTEWVDPVLVTDQQAETYITQWLNAHPDATTTVQDGSITYAKLDTDLKKTRNSANTAISLLKNYGPIALIERTNNMLMGKDFVLGYYYATEETAHQDYGYCSIPLVAGTTYKMRYIRFISLNGSLVRNIETLQITEFTPEDTAVYFVSVRMPYFDAAFLTELTIYDASNYSTFADPILNPNLIAQSLGDSETLVASQNLVTESVSNIPLSNIEGYSLSPNSNLVPYCQFIQGQYYYEENGILEHRGNSNYNTYVLSNPNEATFYFSDVARFVTASNGINVTKADTNANTFMLDVTSEKLYVTVSVDYTDFMFANATPISDNVRYINDLILTRYSNSQVAKNIYSNGMQQVSGGLSSGGSLTLPRTNIKTDNVYSFTGKIETFGSIEIGHGKTRWGAAYVEITATSVVFHNYTNQDVSVPQQHNLTISDFVHVTVKVDKESAVCTLITASGAFTSQSALWRGDGDQDPFVYSNGSVLSDCKFAWTCKNANKSTWLFGDSYFSFGDYKRWTYYANQDGYLDNVLINGYAGENSVNSLVSFTNLIENYGTPKNIVWCLGMNDGSDNGSPSQPWLTTIETLKLLCEQQGITLILATIPTVPTINHEYKNQYVRESGLRYIDFAAAVGANASGVWYQNMLSGDGVHPTAFGAQALYSRVLMDLPEIME